MTNQVNHALTLQLELKTMASQLFKMGDEIDPKQFGWDIELTEDNELDHEIWFGNNYVIDPSQAERGESLIKVKSLISFTKLKRKDNGLYHVSVAVDLPDDYHLPIKIFECEYAYVEGQPLKGFPQSFYQAYLYFSEQTKFTYADKLSYLTGAMWEFAHALGYLHTPDHYDELARFIKEDIVA
ncbi:hypothetical protein [Moritella viscosa]|uniref:hypothetical protein n=1 Tax=Moritella viscosa TaxID=80854 RepID=UPI0009207665|nr:hypothetical protein [Moritella viscosa]SGY81437.1 Putative uncharacterized protein [Moritella viscosa]